MGQTKLDLYEERASRITNAVELKPTDRVPLFSIIDNWALFHYGTTLAEAKNDMDLQYAAYAKAFQDFGFDGASFGAVTMPLGFVDALGGGIYKTDMETIQIATGQSELMEASEYDALTGDTIQFMLDKLIPRKLSVFREGSVEDKFGVLANAIQVVMGWVGALGEITEKHKTESGVFVPNAVVPFMPADLIFDYLRDFKGTLNDVRRCPDQLAAAAMAILQNINIPVTYAMVPQPAREKYLTTFLHLPAFLRPRDFEKVYWPSFKAYIEMFAAQGYKFMIFFERNWEHLYDYLQELPRGCILGFFEDDDLRKTKAALGDVMCIGGGIKTTDLFLKTPAQCVDITKGLLQDLAPGGGYIFTTNKILNSKNDANPECLKAVADYVLENSYY